MSSGRSLREPVVRPTLATLRMSHNLGYVNLGLSART